MPPSLRVAPTAAAAPAGRLDRAALTTLATLGAVLAFVAWDQSFWWRSQADYRFGWLAPFFVAYAVHRRWGEIGRLLAELRVPPAPGAPPPSRRVRLADLAVRAVFGAAVLLFLLGALSRAAAGPSHPASLALALGAAGLTLALVHLSGTPATPAAIAARRRLVALSIYPAFVWLLTMPLLTAGEARLSTLLLGRIEAVVLAVFHLLHLPVQLQGNVFVLRGGPVALEEACLGLRSITGCLFGGFFLAEICLRRWRWRAGVLGAALALALFTNLLRVLFLNLWAHKFGPHAIEGLVHDSSGWIVLVLSAIGLFLLTTWFERREARAAD